jgi:hypothetical protein
MSSAQSQAFVWDHQEEEESDLGLEYFDDDEDRLYTFEISQTNEQEESVVPRPLSGVQSYSSSPNDPTNYF